MLLLTILQDSKVYDVNSVLVRMFLAKMVDHVLLSKASGPVPAHQCTAAHCTLRTITHIN